MIKGFPLQQGSTYSKEQHFNTIQKAGLDKYGIDCLPKVGAIIKDTTVASVLYNETTRIVTVGIAVHGAKNHNIVRFIDGSEEGNESPIFAIVDANTIQLYGKHHLEDIQVGDGVQIIRYITQTTDANGALAVSVPTAPAQFVLDGVNQQVVEDTVDPSNNLGLPVKKISPEFLDYFSLDFAADNVGVGAFVELSSGVGTKTVSKVQIFMSGGVPLILAYGAVGFEEEKALVMPGGNGIIEVTIPPNTRLSVKSTLGTISEGLLLINLLG